MCIEYDVHMKGLSTTKNSVFTEKNKLYTKSIDPKKRVYHERLVYFDDEEYREWSPSRSKMSAYLSLGGKHFFFKEDSKVLYLGAANGTTVSHISDIAHKGKIYAVEFSPRSFRDLVKISETRKNINPILADATNPEEYSFIVEKVDIVYSDVAQKNQADILADNMERYCARYGYLCLKSRSEDVTLNPKVVLENTEKILKKRGLKIIDSFSLEPYEKDHNMIVVEKQKTTYCVAFQNDKFLMVFNDKRNGWEMPGGKVEVNETIEEASVRECLEESGYEIKIIETKNIGYCDVCSALIVSKKADGEMKGEFFSELPNNLSFDTDEYECVISWAKNSIKTNK